MGDVPIRPKAEPEPTVADKVEDIAVRVNAAAQAVVPGVALRRAVLFAIVAWGLAFSGLWAGIALVALIVLALTDQAVDL